MVFVFQLTETHHSRINFCLNFNDRVFTFEMKLISLQKQNNDENIENHVQRKTFVDFIIIDVYFQSVRKSKLFNVIKGKQYTIFAFIWFIKYALEQRAPDSKYDRCNVLQKQILTSHTHTRACTLCSYSIVRPSFYHQLTILLTTSDDVWLLLLLLLQSNGTRA